jgi:hypothetical protein
MEIFSEGSDSDRYTRSADVFFDVPIRDAMSTTKHKSQGSALNPARGPSPLDP